ncbi:hypothetical protein E2I00_006271 [Balaenoptera physalus]|uniref:Fanconi anemia group F protein n=1 Tax=Balaenoptera physalus TaxID=9770 RepID=A0A6A1QEW1_BALPH|nr:hypothetical protein E2I00_006271 [Balaenoptera physalus]
MEPLLQHLERFSEVLAVSRTTHVSTWDPATVRRALQWARYLRHIHKRFGRHARISKALERRLQNQWKQPGDSGPAPAPGLANFQALGHCDQLLSLRLLANPALGGASFHYLLQQLFPGPGEDSLMKTQAELLLRRLQEVGEAEAGGPGRLLSSLWERSPQNNFLKVVAAALLLPPSSPRPQEEELELGSPRTPGEEGQELLRWLLGKSDVMVAFCRSLPAGLLTSVAGRHPELSRAYLGLLTDWGRQLRYSLQKGLWIGTESQDVPWEELLSRFQSLCQAPPPLKDEVFTALKSCKAQDGDFEVPGLSIWTDLLLSLGSSA